MKAFKAIAAASLLCAGTISAKADPLPAPLTNADYMPIDIAEAVLGQKLFYDAILSGNRVVSCGTCHHPRFGTADGVSLSFGDGGVGLGDTRRASVEDPPEKRIPRNAPALFNLGATEFTVMFHDGRLEADPDTPSGLRTPLGNDMPQGFDNILSAQTMFPVLSRDEMAGSYDENPVALAVRQGRITGDGGAWDLLSRRVAAIPEYVDDFTAAYPHIEGPDDIAFTDISNAISAFIAFEWRSDTSPFDQYLRGDDTLEPAARAGMLLFYGAAGCAACHSGAFQTDHRFHAMAAPQIGPGKGADFETHKRDTGRYRVTGAPADLYAFRTPSLRNVALTAPYGHAGSHTSLAEFIRDHADPVASLARYDPAMAFLPDATEADFALLNDADERAAIASAVRTEPVALTAQDIEDIEAFLHSLSDPRGVIGRLGIPSEVPSGLALP